MLQPPLQEQHTTLYTGAQCHLLISTPLFYSPLTAYLPSITTLSITGRHKHPLLTKADPFVPDAQAANTHPLPTHHTLAVREPML